MTDTTATTTARADGMLCPVCKVNLMLSDRQGIEIDYCPNCRGVWLDRGELDKIIERNANYPGTPPAAEPPAYQAGPGYAPSPWGGHDDYRRTDHHGEGRHGESRHGDNRYGDNRHGGPRRGGFLGGLFDH